MTTTERSIDTVSYAGAGLAVVGLAHFVVPQAFAPVTSPLFPEDTTSWTYRNGACETAIGVALTQRKTRPFGWAALGAYLGFLSYRAARSRL